jgi:DNA-binding transcriptional ArsR family regulator
MFLHQGSLRDLETEVKVHLPKCLSQFIGSYILIAMSVSEEDTYSMIFTSLKHPIRRGILRILSGNPQSFSDLQRLLKIESSHLTYHLEGLGNLLVKTEEGKYALSSLGEAAVSTMKHVEEPHKAYPSPRLSFSHRNLMHLPSSNKNWSTIILTIEIALLASSFLFFYLSSSSEYDHITTYNHVANIDAHPYYDPITNVSAKSNVCEYFILLQPHDYLTVSVENLPANGTVYLGFEGLPLDDPIIPLNFKPTNANVTLTNATSITVTMTNTTTNIALILFSASVNGFLDFRNSLSTNIWGGVIFASETSQTYFITMNLHHYEMTKWLFFSVGVILASLGLVTVFKSVLSRNITDYDERESRV